MYIFIHSFVMRGPEDHWVTSLLVRRSFKSSTTSGAGHTEAGCRRSKLLDFSAFGREMLAPLVCFLLLPSRSSAETNDRPVIGVLSQEVADPSPGRSSYIAASYVKFLEEAGARVAPVRINRPPEEYKTLFSSINGVLFPGGAASIYSSGYQRAAQFFLEASLQANQRGDYFPVWGTCLGFEEMMYLISGEPVLSRTNTSGIALPLNFTNEANRSRLFESFPDDLMEALSSEPLTENSHMWSVALSTFDSSDKLKTFFKVLSTNHDGHTEFISTVEAFRYPLYGTQWHPEKNAFEWRRSYYPHSPSAVRMTFYMAQFFVGEAKKSFHKFRSEAEERKWLIYNFSPVYTDASSSFEQIYYFE